MGNRISIRWKTNVQVKPVIENRGSRGSGEEKREAAGEVKNIAVSGLGYWQACPRRRHALPICLDPFFPASVNESLKRSFRDTPSFLSRYRGSIGRAVQNSLKASVDLDGISDRGTVCRLKFERTLIRVKDGDSRRYRSHETFVSSAAYAKGNLDSPVTHFENLFPSDAEKTDEGRTPGKKVTRVTFWHAMPNEISSGRLNESRNKILKTFEPILAQLLK